MKQDMTRMSDEHRELVLWKNKQEWKEESKISGQQKDANSDDSANPQALPGTQTALDAKVVRKMID